MLKRSFAAFIALLGLNGATAAQTATKQTAAPQETAAQAAAMAARTCMLPKIADTAPLDQLPGTDLMGVPVTIDGTTRQFLLDLGMNKPTAVSPELMAKLRIPESPKFGGVSTSPSLTGASD